MLFISILWFKCLSTSVEHGDHHIIMFHFDFEHVGTTSTNQSMIHINHLATQSNNRAIVVFFQLHFVLRWSRIILPISNRLMVCMLVTSWFSWWSDEALVLSHHYYTGASFQTWFDWRPDDSFFHSILFCWRWMYRCRPRITREHFPCLSICNKSCMCSMLCDQSVN